MCQIMFALFVQQLTVFCPRSCQFGVNHGLRGHLSQLFSHSSPSSRAPDYCENQVKTCAMQWKLGDLYVTGSVTHSECKFNSDLATYTSLCTSGFGALDDSVCISANTCKSSLLHQWLLLLSHRQPGRIIDWWYLHYQVSPRYLKSSVSIFIQFPGFVLFISFCNVSVCSSSTLVWAEILFVSSDFGMSLLVICLFTGCVVGLTFSTATSKPASSKTHSRILSL